MKLTRHFFVVGALSAAFLAPLANAVPIDINTASFIGKYVPGSAFNNDADSLTAANAIVIWYNGGTNANTLSGPPHNPVFTLGAAGLAPLPTSLSLGYRDETDPADSSFSNMTYTYVLGKFGNTSYLYYLGNLVGGDYSLPADFSSQTTGDGLSHYVTFTVRNPPFLPPPGVPDGGSTAVMLGLGLIGMAVMVRRRS